MDGVLFIDKAQTLSPKVKETPADVAAFVEERQYHYGTLTAYTNSGLAIPNFFNLAPTLASIAGST